MKYLGTYGTAQLQGNIRIRLKCVQDTGCVQNTCGAPPEHMQDISEMHAGHVRTLPWS